MTIFRPSRPPEHPGLADADDPAARSLVEAEARRRQGDLAGAIRPKEIDGRPGPEPVRYGDWENRGIASDF